MSRLVWDATGDKQYEVGVSNGVLFTYNETNHKWEGVPWNGLITVEENPEGADEQELYADNIKYGGLIAAEKFGGKIEAYTYPEEFEECDGMSRPATGLTIGQQKRKKFCLCYRTEIGNDLTESAGYKLHIVYNATAKPSSKSFGTINDNPDAITFSWDFNTTPVPVTGFKPTSLLVVDSTDYNTDPLKAKLMALENKLYGTDAVPAVEADVEHNIAAQEAIPATNSELPTPDELIAMITSST